MLNANEKSESLKIEKVFGSSPPMNYLIYALNPQKMLGLNFPARNINNSVNEKYLKKSFLDLPIIGSFHGSSQNINIESLIKYNPDLILVWEDDYLFDVVKNHINKTKIRSVVIPFRKVDSMPSSILIAAKAIGEEKRGKLLADYAKKRIEFVQNLIKDEKKVRYYYAEGTDGLSTECDNSFHTEALNFAGGDGVHKCTQSNVLGLEKITFEKLLEYNPEVIIAQNRLVYNTIIANPMWEHIDAVKNNRVFVVPNTPFNWIDRPPSFMRIIGFQIGSLCFTHKKRLRDCIECPKKNWNRAFGKQAIYRTKRRTKTDGFNS